MFCILFMMFFISFFCGLPTCLRAEGSDVTRHLRRFRTAARETSCLAKVWWSEMDSPLAGHRARGQVLREAKELLLTFAVDDEFVLRPRQVSLPSTAWTAAVR